SMKAFMHRAGGHSGSDQQAFDPHAELASGWHDAVIEWVAGKEVKFSLDGQPFGTSTVRVPAGPMHWVLQAETAIGEPAPTPADAGHVLIDDVNVAVPD